jgi:hypothetical protein
VPWNSSSLTGEFAFNQKAEITFPTLIIPPIPKPEKNPDTQKPIRPLVIESTPTLEQPKVCPGNEKNC